MAELISSLIYDIARGTTNSCFPASQRNLASVLHEEAFSYSEENSLEMCSINVRNPACLSKDNHYFC